MNDKNLRSNLVEFLRGGQAHASVEQALAGIDPQNRNLRPPGFDHCVYELLEHLRLAQEDIVRYTLDPQWKSPPFPDGYWPANADQMTGTDWERASNGFRAGLEEAIQLVNNSDIEITSEIPHGEGRTYLREILLIADHNAYHLAQIVQIRKLLNDWHS